MSEGCSHAACCMCMLLSDSMHGSTEHKGQTNVPTGNGMLAKSGLSKGEACSCV